jgi:hypothetical protein
MSRSTAAVSSSTKQRILAKAVFGSCEAVGVICDEVDMVIKYEVALAAAVSCKMLECYG